MSFFSVTPGEHYGYRKSRSLGTSVQHIEVIAKAKPGVWKVKFIDGPNAGLTDFVRTGTIAVRWAEAEAFTKDELLLLKVLEAADAQEGHGDETIVTAINSVLEATGDWGYLRSYSNRVGHVPIEAARRILRRARLDPDPLKLDPVSFVDRDGNLNLTFEACLRLAQSFARAEPDTVLTHLEADERDYMERYGDRAYMVQAHSKDKAAHALAREWTEAPEADRRMNYELDELHRVAVGGIEKLHSRFSEIDQQKTHEIQRLRGLILSAADELRSLGAEDKADRLLLALNRPARPQKK